MLLGHLLKAEKLPFGKKHAKDNLRDDNSIPVARISGILVL